MNVKHTINYQGRKVQLNEKLLDEYGVRGNMYRLIAIYTAKSNTLDLKKKQNKKNIIDHSNHVIKQLNEDLIKAWGREVAEEEALIEQDNKNGDS